MPSNSMVKRPPLNRMVNCCTSRTPPAREVAAGEKSPDGMSQLACSGSMQLDHSNKGVVTSANMPYGELLPDAPPIPPRREVWARPADMTPRDEQGICSQPCSSDEAREAKRLREAASVPRDTQYHCDFPVLEGQDARDFFPGVFSEHEETFRRQNGSEATFCDSSLLGIANPNEFRTETAQRSQKQEFGITEKVINEDYILVRQQNGSEGALVESSL